MIARYPTKSQRNAEVLKCHATGAWAGSIAETTGVAESTVRDILRANGLTPNKAPTAPSNRREDERNANVVADMSKRETTGESVGAIAARYRISRQRVYAICNAEVKDGTNSVSSK